MTNSKDRDPSVANHKHDYHYVTNQEHNWDYLTCKICNFSPDKEYMNAVAGLIEVINKKYNIPDDIAAALDAVREQDYTYNA